MSLRDKWLSLLSSTFYDNNKTYHATTKPLSAKNPRPAPYHHSSKTDAHALSQINVFPSKASASLVAKFSTHPSDEQIAEFENGQLLRELLKNDAVSLCVRDGKEAVAWDVGKGLVECPDKEDLIGFVTSGGYNLAEGRGTAVGGVWVQRVREGWLREEQEWEEGLDVGGSSSEERRGRKVAVDGGLSLPSSSLGAGERKGKGKGNMMESSGVPKATGTADKTNQAEKLKARRIKERMLCVVRNAGSGVGRLGWWEVCE